MTGKTRPSDETLVLHVGMPKSGSTSIQDALYNSQQEIGFRYIGFGQVNGSRAMRTIFSNSATVSRLHMVLGLDNHELEALRGRLAQRLENALSRCQRSRVFPIISAEWCWRMTTEELRNVREYFLARGFRTEVIAYVRPLWGWYASALQEDIKWGVATFNPFHSFNDRPSLRHESDLAASIAVLDDVFGADRVQIVPFERSILHGGCVVRDFFHRLGLELNPRLIRRSNEGLCHDALTLLHASNTHGEGFGRGRGVVELNIHLQRRLSRMEGRPFSFHRSLLDSKADEIELQHAAVSNRIGTPFGRRPPPKENDHGIRHAGDLLTFSPASLKWLERESGCNITKCGKELHHKVAEAVDRLRRTPLARDRWHRTLRLLHREWRRVWHGV
jgi:hypothetical protein